MLQITIPDGEFFNDDTQEFYSVKGQTLMLEHSLVSISKWESKYKKAFLSDDPKHKKTEEELLYYIKCMTITQNVKDDVYRCISVDNINKIVEYINDPMTATWFSNQPKRQLNRETLTSELLYYYMIAYRIPFECQKWHLNRLITLIKICDLKNQDNKMSKNDIYKQNAKLNAERRKALKTKG